MMLTEKSPGPHGDEESRNEHDAMGFRDGWGTVLEQLVAHIKTVPLRS